MRRRVTVALLALTGAGIAAGAPSAGGQGEAQTTPTAAITPRAAPATVAAKQVIRPKRRITRRVRFRPWAAPSVAQVKDVIIPIEARGSASVYATLMRRINCESHYVWNAPNGQYLGLGQFASSTFDRGVTTLGNRDVRYATKRLRRPRVRIAEQMSDGTARFRMGWRVRQFVRVVHVGRIPRHPKWTHGWAQVRIMAQAIRGQSAVSDSEWECR